MAHWQPIENELKKFVRKHPTDDPWQFNIPHKLVRVSLRLYREIVALTDTLSKGRQVNSFSDFRLVQKVLCERAATIKQQIIKMAHDFLKLETSYLFGRQLFRLKCRLVYPAGAILGYVIGNFESSAPSRQEAVGILQHECTRLDTDIESTFEFVHGISVKAEQELKQLVEKKDEEALFFIFADSFANTTKLSFLENFCVLAENFGDPKFGHRLFEVMNADNMEFGSLGSCPLIAVFGGRVALFHHGEFIDCGKSLLEALSKWICYIRDVMGSQLFQFSSGSVDGVEGFLSTYFPR